MVAATALQAADQSRPVYRLAFHQAGFDLRAILRNNQSRFFTLALPVMFLLIFSSAFGGANNIVKIHGGSIPAREYYVPSIIALGIIAASFVNLIMSVTVQREIGVLKRRKATPIPASSIIAGRVLAAVVVVACMTTVLVLLGSLLFSTHLPVRSLPALVVTVGLGTAVFSCLAYAVVSFIRNDEAAQPITMAIMLPLYLISGVFVPVSILPNWLGDVASVFPVHHLASGLLTVYNPHSNGTGFAGWDLLVLAAWGTAGLIVALRRFSWLPLGP